MALEQFKLDGQVAIVTGAGKGVGQGIARVLAEAGATVVGTARTESDIEGTIADIESAGGKGLALVADAMSRPDGERVVNTAMERFGRIDILVNNVGGSTYARFLDITDEDFRHTFDWCVTSAFIMSQLVGTAHARGRSRLHREHLVGLGPLRHPSADGLLRRQGRTGSADESHGAGTRAEDPRQRDRPRLLRHRRTARQPGPDARVPGEDERVHAAAPARQRRGPGDGSVSICPRATATPPTRSSMWTAGSTRTTRRYPFPTTERGTASKCAE